MGRKISGKDMALATGALLTTAAFMAAWAFPLWPGDEAALRVLQGWQNPALTTALHSISYLGEIPVAVALTAIIVASTFIIGYRGNALLIALAAMPTVLVLVWKPLVGRPRPDYAIIDPIPQTLAFPSGHATFALLLAGVLIYLAGRLENQWLRWGAISLLAAAIILMGVSRIYLGVHWPSDVIGGYLYGGVGLTAVIRLWNRLTEWRKDKTKLEGAFPPASI